MAHLPYCLPEEDFLRNGGCDLGCGNLTLVDADGDGSGGGGSCLPTRPGGGGGGFDTRGVGDGTLGGDGGAVAAPFDFAPPLPNGIPRLLKYFFFQRISFYHTQ